MMSSDLGTGLEGFTPLIAPSYSSSLDNIESN